MDLVPPAYLEEFKRLQDNVRTFSTVEAREVLESGLGCSVDRVFEWLSAEPLAAASLGQVRDAAATGRSKLRYLAALERSAQEGAAVEESAHVGVCACPLGATRGLRCAQSPLLVGPRLWDPLQVHRGKQRPGHGCNSSAVWSVCILPTCPFRVLHPQVYRGKLRPEHGGTEVAVKVQRPAVLETVALDIFIMRRAAVLVASLPGVSGAWSGRLRGWHSDQLGALCVDVCDVAGARNPPGSAAEGA